MFLMPSLGAVYLTDILGQIFQYLRQTNHTTENKPINSNHTEILVVYAEVKGSQENASESSHCRDADHTSEAYSGRNTLHTSNVRNSVEDEIEYFVIPDLPDEIEVTKSQVPTQVDENWSRFSEEIYAAESGSFGVIMNSFQELELEYERMYKTVKKDKVWCVGPVSLINKDQLKKVQRGNNVSVEEWKHQNWLDSQKPKSVIYACLGSLSNVTTIQLIKICLALEESIRPFIWVIREGNQLEALEKWIKEDGFEERIKGKSLIIRGWAPHLLILSHPSSGGFLTHCGWNSTLKAICTGMPMLTWPLFADQFLNEKLVVKVLKVGVMVGVKSPTTWGKEEEVGELAKKEDIKIVIEELMDENNGECEEKREMIRKLAEIAKRSVEEGGSSHKAGLPEGCENFDMLPSLGNAINLLNATSIFVGTGGEAFRRVGAAAELLRPNDVREIIKDESEDFFVLGTSDKIEVTKQLALSPNNEKWNKFSEEKRTNYSIVTQQVKSPSLPPQQKCCG
ncbi:UDP-glycosyltransferase [Arachis hypogaea]|nr:UDP-glycosyltransferase [Arachis hypogaea]